MEAQGKYLASAEPLVQEYHEGEVLPNLHVSPELTATGTKHQARAIQLG